MKIRNIAFPLTYAACLVLFAHEAQAKASQQVEDMSKWTQDQVYAYLDKYNIVYDKKDENLLDTAARYRDAAVVNTNNFIADKVDGITRFMNEIHHKLEKQYHLTSSNADQLSNDISHELKQLELSGQLTEDKVKQALEQYKSKAIKQKYVTEAQWKDIANDISYTFSHPSWYKRLFSSNHYFNEDAFQSWITSTVKDRLQKNKDYTQKQLDSIGSTLQSAIQSTSASASDLSKIGTAAWWNQFSKDLQKNSDIKKDQAQAIVDALSEDINSYKIFAMNYVGDAADKSQNLFAQATQYIVDSYQAVVHPQKTRESAISVASQAASSATSSAASSASSLAAQVTQTVNEYKDYVADNANSAKDYVADNAYSAKDYVAGNAQYAADNANYAKDYVSDSASSAKDYVSDSASSAKDYVVDSYTDTKNNFARFWRQKELDTYRQIGYTQAHIDWMENYLSSTFHDKTNVAKDTVQNAIQTIRNYLIAAKVQTVTSIDAQMKSLESMIENWRRHRDEL